MTLYLVGLGLYDAKDITLRGLEAVKSCDTIYLEHYTSILAQDKESLEKLYEKEVQIRSRDMVEKEAEEKLILPAKEKNVALLIVGDVFGATTHTDLLVRAKEAGVNVEVIFNASILNAIGIVGLELYKYGKTTSIVFPDDNWLPETPYEVIKNNKSLGLHTLCLLDIKVAEPTKEDLIRQARGEQVTAAPPRYMTVNQGIAVLKQIEEKRQDGIITDDMQVIGVARLGQPDYVIKSGTLKEILEFDFGSPLHCLIIPGKLHHIEEEALL
ncbi:MAG: diphthine synthase [Simkania sp.]|nr:diphthine synthase [Simkania sp.]